MPDKKLFEAVNKNVNKFEILLQNYTAPALEKNLPTNAAEVDIPNEEDTRRISTVEAQARNVLLDPNERYSAFANGQILKQPRICLWVYLSEKAVKDLLNITCKKTIRKIIEDRMESEYPKGTSRLLIVELMYSVMKFCQKHNFNLAQTGSLLSIFYLTHEFFTSSLYTTPESTYDFFREYLLLHSFECPPDAMQLFTHKESTNVIQYFCLIYLQNLPLVRLLALPNFGFFLNYTIPPDTFQISKEKKKGKGDKKAKKKK